MRTRGAEEGRGRGRGRATWQRVTDTCKGVGEMGEEEGVANTKDQDKNEEDKGTTRGGKQ